MKRFDVIVLGAGMVGIATALALLQRGRSVALVDRRGPAEETSYGNAGLIQSEAVMPYAFPRDFGAILGTLAGRRTDARISWRALRDTAPWLLAYARASDPARVAATAAANVPLVREAIPAHRALSERAGAMHFWHLTGYLRLYRDSHALQRAAADNETIRQRYDVPYAVWDAERLQSAEPHLSEIFVGAIHMPEPVRIDDPGGLGKAYAALFEAEGGTFIEADAMALGRDGEGFSLSAPDGPIAAREAVVCLGPWSGDLVKRFGVRLPLGVKRGYHRHYKPAGNATLNHLVFDEAHGYVLTPQRLGIRLTTGAEFARRDDPPSPVQLQHVEPIARTIFPLDEPVEAVPWMGARPCFPDLLPAIGPIPGVGGLFANFGHQHLGFTLGPATGRLLAELMTGEATYTDPAPYSPSRF